jgi:uncharacterized phiE125 gp8 family phage protein
MISAALPTHCSISVTQTVAGEPVDAAYVRANARVGAKASEDAWFTSAITAARQQVEALTRRTLVRTQYRARLSGFEGVNQFGEAVPLALPKGPALSLVGLAYRGGTSGALVQMEVEDPDVIAEIVRQDPRGESALMLKYGKSWPTPVSAWDAVVVEWWAGAPAAVNPQTQAQATAAACPEELRLAIARLVANMYENRHAATEKLGGFAVPEDVGSEIRQACWRWMLAY